MTGTVKGIPDGASVVIPRLFCRDPTEEVEFCYSGSPKVEDGYSVYPHIALMLPTARTHCRKSVTWTAFRKNSGIEDAWYDRCSWRADSHGST
jgi:hypothetical protein